MKTEYTRADLPEIQDAQIAILQSSWYSGYSDTLVRHCKELLSQTKCREPVLHQLPGAMELPFAARTVAHRNPRLEAIIIFGIIIRGETAHFDMIVDLCTRGFERVMYEEDVPLIIELLPVENEDQAKARCADNDSNKGREAATAAAKMIEWRRAVEKR